MRPISVSLCTIILIISATFAFLSCDHNDEPDPTPVITSFSPYGGLVGSEVTIHGNHFIPPAAPDGGIDPHPNTSIIKFNGIVAEAEFVYQDSIGKQRIQTIVPSGATSAPITVTADGVTAASQNDFYIITPIYLSNVMVTTVSDHSGIDIDIDDDGNFFVSDNESFEIFKLSPDGTKTTLLSTISETNRGDPMGIAVDANGNVFATVGNTIRKIFPDGTVVVLAGSTSNEIGYVDGKGADARFNIPWGISVDASGDLYVADFLNYKIRKITQDGTVTTFAGSTSGSVDGPANEAQFAGPIGVKVDFRGNVLVTESGKIRKINPDGNVTTIAGNSRGYLDGPTTEAQFNSPRSIEIDLDGNIYITDSDNYVIRRISPEGAVVTVAGSTFGVSDGPGASAKFCQTKGITMGPTGALYITQGGGCGKIRKIVIN